VCLNRADADHPRTPDHEGAHGGERDRYGIERPYVAVKGPHGRERAPCR